MDALAVSKTFIFPHNHHLMQIFQKTADRFRITTKQFLGYFLAALLGIVSIFYVLRVMGAKPKNSYSATSLAGTTDTIAVKDSVQAVASVLDTAEFNKQLIKITNGDSSGRWPVKTNYPKAGAILPFKRIVAYYGNFYSKKMGILGEYSADTMLAKLQADVEKWRLADSTVEVQPALHYIAVTAQGEPGKGSKYRLRMPFKQIDSVIKLAARINALVFLDIQIGLSSVQDEIPLLATYLKMPQVHLGIDPEFSMKTGKKPGSVIGTMDAADINYVIHYLSDLARINNLPPKILVVHRFTHAMVTNYKKIDLDSNVQVVMDMDGWGAQSRKLTTYHEFIYKEPVEFTGFKLFYKNDYREPKSRMMTPAEVLRLKPQPMYIQYQ